MSSYTRYKQHTSSFITWIVESSKGLGYHDHDQTPLPTQTPVVSKGRKKGAARKLGKAAANVQV
jgi:hypothetical protein